MWFDCSKGLNGINGELHPGRQAGSDSGELETSGVNPDSGEIMAVNDQTPGMATQLHLP